MGAYLKEKFISLSHEFSFIGDVRGRGLFLGIEFVKDQKTKEIFSPEMNFAKLVEKTAMDNGLITYGCRGTVELSKGDHMLFAPPLTLTKEEADLIYEKLKITFMEVSRQLESLK